MVQAKKTVHFALEEELVTVHKVCSYLDESENLFLSDREFEALKQSSLLEACQVRKSGVDKNLESTFRKPSEDVQKRLNRYARNFDCRGLERFISRSHYDERKRHREHAVQAIMIAQRMAKEQNMNPEEVSMQLRKVALVYCIDAKVFARRLGKADEAACCSKKTCHHNHESKVVHKKTSSRAPKKPCRGILKERGLVSCDSQPRIAV